MRENLTYGLMRGRRSDPLLYSTVKDENGQKLLKARTYLQKKCDMDRLISDIRSLSGNSQPLLAMESTGIYHRNLLHYLIDKEFKVRVYNPIEICSLRQRRIRKTKTDKIDAEVIADAVKLDLIEDNLKFNNDPDKLELKEYATSYHRIVEKISVLKLELRTALSMLCPGYDEVFGDITSATSIQILRKAIKHTKLFDISESELERIFIDNNNRKETRQTKINDVLESFNNSTCPEFYKKPLLMNIKHILGQYDVLLEQRKHVERNIKRAIDRQQPYAMSIPGIGYVTGATILGMLGDVTRFDSRDAVAAFAGLDPVVSQSGKMSYRYGHISRRGNKYLRTSLLNASMISKIHNPVIKHKYYELRGNGKSHWTAIIACARKLVHIVYSVEKNQQNFVVPEIIKNEMNQ